MKDSGYLHIVPLIYCTKVDADSDFDIINNKTRRREAKEQIDPTRTLPKGLSESQERNGIVRCFALIVLGEFGATDILMWQRSCSSQPARQENYKDKHYWNCSQEKHPTFQST